MAKQICVLARQQCPETADPSKPHYCPLWRDHMPSVLLDGSYRLVAENPVRGCYFRLIDLYAVSAVAEADHAHAAANEAKTAAINAAEVQTKVANWMGRVLAQPLASQLILTAVQEQESVKLLPGELGEGGT